MAYRADIDGLRAIAVGAVVLFHAHVPGLAGGFVGVDVFFVISGYLITTILLRDTSVVRFYQRRARRILPALFVLVAGVLLAGAALLLPHDLVMTAKSAAATLLFGSNIWFWRQAGYFATETELWPLLHTWSLGVEEQFYIIFPLLIGLFARLRRRWLLLLLVVLTLASFASAVFLMESRKSIMAFYLAPPRAWELLVGSLVATGALPTPRSRTWRSIAAALGLMLLAWGIVDTSDRHFPGWGAVPPVLGTALLIWAGEGERHALTGLLGARPLRFVGLISYSLYLWHWPVLAFARYHAIEPLSLRETAAAVALATGLAVASWRLVERPFRQGMRDRTIWLGSAAGVALLLLASGMIVARQGFPARVPAAVAALNEGQGEDWRCPVTSYIPFGNFYACALDLPTRRAEDADVVLWGDSHAQMYAPALLAALHGRRALLVNAYGCAPIVGDAASPSCGPMQRGNFARIVRLPARTVILAQNWRQYRDEAGKRLGRVPLPSERYGDGVRRLRALVAALRAAGKHVVIIGPTAAPGYELASVAARQLYYDGVVTMPVDEPREAFLTEFANVLTAMYDLGRTPGVTVIRPDEKFCDAIGCRYVIDGRPVFADAGHLTAPSARRVAPLFARALAEPTPPPR